MISTYLVEILRIQYYAKWCKFFLMDKEESGKDKRCYLGPSQTFTKYGSFCHNETDMSTSVKCVTPSDKNIHIASVIHAAY